jgi:hypothetical protein
MITFQQNFFYCLKYFNGSQIFNFIYCKNSSLKEFSCFCVCKSWNKRTRRTNTTQATHFDDFNSTENYSNLNSMGPIDTDDDTDLKSNNIHLWWIQQQQQTGFSPQANYTNQATAACRQS